MKMNYPHLHVPLLSIKRNKTRNFVGQTNIKIRMSKQQLCTMIYNSVPRPSIEKIKHLGPSNHD